MHQVSDALGSAHAAIEHPQCGQTFQRAVADPRPFGDSQALAIVLAVLHHPEADITQKADAANLLAAWEAKCSHWRDDRLNAHNAIPQLPQDYRNWQPYLDAALDDVQQFYR